MRSIRAVVLGTLVVSTLACDSSRRRIRVGAKHFAESVVLAEIITHHLRRMEYPAERVEPCESTGECHEALLAGRLDLYVEYTGTGYGEHLKLKGERDPERIYEIVDSAYRDRWNVEWTPRLGFEDTYAILVRKEFAREHELETISDLTPYAEDLRFGVDREFVDRFEFEGLLETYGLQFDTVLTMKLDSTYIALAQDSVDVIAGNSTDGWIEPLGLLRLQDDRGFLPPYDAAPVVRRETLQDHPGLEEALSQLASLISDREMRCLNYLAGLRLCDACLVAREFWTSKGVKGDPESVVPCAAADGDTTPRICQISGPNISQPCEVLRTAEAVR